MSLLRWLLPRRRQAVARLLQATVVGMRGHGRLRPSGESARNGRATWGGASAGFGFSAFTLFSRQAEKEKEEEEEEDAGGKDKTEDTIIFLLKKAKLSIMKRELEEAEQILHDAARLSHQSDNKAALIYVYDTMANLAILRGQLDHAEKLFKAAMSFLLAGGMKQDDNAIVEISLKLASIYAAQNQPKLAQAGYEFCITTLEEKTEKQKDMLPDAVPEGERANTLLLLGLSLDSYARYLLDRNLVATAQTLYERALKITMDVQGEKHPQTVVVMNDLAIALDAQGHYGDAYTWAKRAAELAQETEHPEAHIILNTLAGILMHKGDFPQAKQVYKEALKKAEENGDGPSVRHIRKELMELAQRTKQSKSTNASQEANQRRN